MTETQISSQETATVKPSDRIDITTLIKNKFPKKDPCPNFVKSLKDQVIKKG